MTLLFSATGSGGLITTAVSWSSGDTTMVTIGNSGTAGTASFTAAGKIWGTTTGISASYQGSTLSSQVQVIASDSSSISTPWGLPHMPQQNDHWQALGISPWGMWFGLQEPTGSMVGSGSVSATMVPTGTINYGKSVTGWTRTALSISGTNALTDDGVAPKFGFAGTAGFSATASFAMLAYGIVQSYSAANASFLGVSGTSTAFSQPSMGLQSRAVGNISLVSSGSIKGLTGPYGSDHGDRIHPFLLVYDITARRIFAATDIAISYRDGTLVHAMQDVFKGIGRVNSLSTAPSASFVYFAVVTGSVAESYSTLSGSANLLSRLGWNVAWQNCPVDSSSIKLPFTSDHWQQLNQTPWACANNFQIFARGSTEGCYDFPSAINWTNYSMGVANGTSVTCLNPIPNWKRAAVSFSGNLNEFMTMGGPGTAVTSAAFLAYVRLNSTTSSISMVSAIRDTNSPQISIFTSASNGILTLSLTPVGGGATAGTQNHMDGRVHPIMMVLDGTNSRAKMYTDLEKVTGTFAVPSWLNGFGPRVGAARSTDNAAKMDCVYSLFCTGTLAESLSDDGVASKLLKDLGWNPPW